MVRRHFLAVFVSLLHLAAAENVKYALLGQTVILNPEIKASGANKILWKHNREKVVEFNGHEQNEYKPFEDRITLYWHTAELEITNLRYEDSGDYELEVNKELISFPFKLKVIGKVSKPSISCEIEDTSSDESGNRASLKCSAESSRSESLMKLEWSWRGSMQPGPNLTIPLGDENDEEEYNCTVSNPMSRETTTFSARNCYSETNLTGIIVSCVVAVITVLLVILGLLLFLKRRRRTPEQNRSDPEQNPLMNTQSNFQSPTQSAGFAEENDNTEPVGLKKKVKCYQEMTDEHENSTPAKPPGLAKPLSPLKLHFSVTSQEGGIDKHKKENNLDQVSGELLQHPAGESSMEEKNQSDEENKSDPEQETSIGRQSTSQSPPQSAGFAEQNDDTEPVNVKKTGEIFERTKGENRSDHEQETLVGRSSTSQSPPQSPRFAEQNDNTKPGENRSDREQNTLIGGPSTSRSFDKLPDFAERNDNTEPGENKSDREQKTLIGGPSTSQSREELLVFAERNDNTEPGENRSDREQKTLIGGRLNSWSLDDFPDFAERNDNTEPGENRSDREQETLIGRRLNSRSLDYFPDFAERNDNTEPGEETFSTLPYSPEPPSPPTMDPSSIPGEDGIDNHKEDNNLDQASGELPK
ncbi:uncharacterized protein LOC115403786 isoform X1 [Salarias fasciatus]|uniref:Uncharacterized LOC115403786 n=1 Tax=Salarias fasciatus TaxID=181472 RepID=A0A672JU90_SALFA|nr:uncharacterized protein LOC115403786 isoform X1 [Salarias fasciatus]